MPRPRRRRRIRRRPERMWFKPRGVPLSEIDKVDLNSDEIEAMRLKHMQEMTQEEAAEEMNVSRSTFARIIKEAHKKVTEFLVKGHALQIQERKYAHMPREFICKKCEYQWNAPYGEGRPKICPECKSQEIELKKPKSSLLNDDIGGD